LIQSPQECPVPGFNYRIAICISLRVKENIS
jgi:hypothetical protein